MGKKIVRTIAYFTACVMCCLMLTGCGLVPSLDLTEEQSTLIAEYAAGKLLEYVKGHPGGLMILEDVDRADVNPGMKKPEEEVPMVQPPTEISQDALEPVSPLNMPPADSETAPAPPADEGVEALVASPEGGGALPTKTIAEALGIEGATVTYDSFEVTPTYPENAVELAFSMKAAPGKDLLVVHFALNNPTGSDIEAYTDSSNFKVRLLLNGSDKIRGDVTFLDNDLMNYRGVLSPGSSVDSVLVFEIPQGTEVNTMDLLIVEDGGEQKYNIL